MKRPYPGGRGGGLEGRQNPLDDRHDKEAPSALEKAEKRSPEKPGKLVEIKKEKTTVVETDFDPKIDFESRKHAGNYRLVSSSSSIEDHLPLLKKNHKGRQQIEVDFAKSKQPLAASQWLNTVGNYEPPKDFVHPFTLMDAGAKEAKLKTSMFTLWYDKNGQLWSAMVDESSVGGKKDLIITPANPDAKWSNELYGLVEDANGQEVVTPGPLTEEET